MRISEGYDAAKNDGNSQPHAFETNVEVMNRARAMQQGQLQLGNK